MKPKNVNMLVFISRCSDEAQAGFQSIGATPAEGGTKLLARGVSKSEVTRQTVAAWEQRVFEGGQ